MTMPTCSTGIQSVSLKPATDMVASRYARRAAPRLLSARPLAAGLGAIAAASGPRRSCTRAAAPAAFRLGCCRLSETLWETHAEGGVQEKPVQARQVLAMGSRCSALDACALRRLKIAKVTATTSNCHSKRVLPDLPMISRHRRAPPKKNRSVSDFVQQSDG